MYIGTGIHYLYGKNNGFIFERQKIIWPPWYNHTGYSDSTHQGSSDNLTYQNIQTNKNNIIILVTHLDLYPEFVAFGPSVLLLKSSKSAERMKMNSFRSY